MKQLLILLPLATLAFAEGSGRLQSVYMDKDAALTADPLAAHWKDVKPVILTLDRNGKPVPKHTTEVRSRWTNENLYLLFVCPYEQLNLKPQPSTTTETNKLWDWDVAEVFIGSDFKNIGRYKELQVSPQGEWVDLDIDKTTPQSRGAGVAWNSGFTVKARIDESKKVWYGEMKIPLRALDSREPKAGNEMRMNCYRIQGPGKENRVHVNWNVVNAPSFHTPEAFGRLVLVK